MCNVSVEDVTSTALAGIRDAVRVSQSYPGTNTHDDHNLTVEAKIVHRPGILALRPRPAEKQRPRTSAPTICHPVRIEPQWFRTNASPSTRSPPRSATA